MTMTNEDAVKEYQCSGCVGGPYEKCFTKKPDGAGCAKHCPGTMMMPIGKIFLGMPRGFNRLGAVEKMPLDIFESIEKKNEQWGTFDDMNIPTWKYLDGFGNTFVRGHSPRTNGTFTMVIMGDCREAINCFEVTNELMKKID